MYTFIVTNMDMEPYQIIQFYCGRGRMENFVKEGKSGFDFDSVSSCSKVVGHDFLLVLFSMLSCLKATGHRVLIEMA